MRYVTSDATFSLKRCVLVGERTLFVSMTLNARSISAGCQPRLLQFETAVWVVTIAALHHALQDFVMKRLVEVRLYFTMTTNAELGLPDFQ